MPILKMEPIAPEKTGFVGIYSRSSGRCIQQLKICRRGANVFETKVQRRPGWWAANFLSREGDSTISLIWRSQISFIDWIPVGTHCNTRKLRILNKVGCCNLSNGRLDNSTKAFIAKQVGMGILAFQFAEVKAYLWPSNHQQFLWGKGNGWSKILTGF